MARIIVITIIVLNAIILTAKSQSIDHKVFLLGNLPDIKDPEAFATRFTRLLKSVKEPYTILINGDLITGKPTGQNTQPFKELLTKVNDISEGNIIIIPGDRDWDNSGKNGWEYVKQLEELVLGWGLDKVQWPNDDACPGPKDILLSDNLMLITIDTQWWNHPYRKPTPADADCKIATGADYYEELTELIDENDNKNVLIAGHYPIMANGHFGGRFSLGQWLFPLPVIQGFITSFRQNIGRPADLSNKNYQPFAQKMTNVLKDYNSLIYAGTHEKNLEIIKDSANYFVNGGIISQDGYSAANENVVFSSEKPGVLAIDYYKNGSVSTTVYRSKGNIYAKEKEITLFGSICAPTDPANLKNKRFMPCHKEPVVRHGYPTTNKDTLAIAGPEYRKGPLFKFFFGNHYRKSWTTPVRVGFLNMDTAKGGLTPYAVGGGRQTKSLKLKGGDGMEYVFRSVNKNPIKALPYELRGTVISSVVKDQTTTQQPYGAMAASVLLGELDIYHARPTLYMLPDGPALGNFKNEFGNMLGMLEAKPYNPDKVDSAFAGAKEIERSLRMFRDLYEDNDNDIADEEFVKARVFDILVGDWGKHEDNWKWIGFEKEKGLRYHPFPRDRDHVFSRWDGLLPWIADREWAKPSGENFDYKIKGLRSLMWQARHLDRALANEATKEDWLAAAATIQDKVTDSVIENAVQNMPPEIYEPDGRIIEEKLKARKKDLEKYAEEYYLILAKEVDVIGSEKDEYFEVERKENGTVEVQMFKIKDGEIGKLLYRRTFYPKETKEIRLFGLDDEDVFNIHGHTDKSILLRIVPGPAQDSITDTSSVSGWGKKTLVYEADEKECHNLTGEAKSINSRYPDAYIYNRTAFEYNTYLPLVYISYNVDNGLGIHGGVSFTRQKYGKPGFSSQHFVNATATTLGNVVIDYEGRWKYTVGKWDAFVNGTAGIPNNINYYFGRGNNTNKGDSLFDSDYYDVQYNTISINTGLVRDFLKFSSLRVEAGYEKNSEELKEDNIISIPEGANDPSIPGMQVQDFLIAKIKLDLDFRDQVNLSKRGMRLFLNYKNGTYLRETKYDDFGIASGSLEQYMSNYWNNPVTIGLRVGGSTSFGDVPFYHLKYLGQKNDLKGFRRNRFTGKSTAFLNSELRVQLLDTKTKLIPLKIGLRGFVDSGRVFDDLNDDNGWHTGYGAGFYIVPLRERFSLNLSVSFSEEEPALILFSLGNVFN